MSEQPPREPREPSTRPPTPGELFDQWFPRGRDAMIFVIGAGGTVYATAVRDLALLGFFGPFLIGGGYVVAKGRKEDDDRDR